MLCHTPVAGCLTLPDLDMVGAWIVSTRAANKRCKVMPVVMHAPAIRESAQQARRSYPIIVKVVPHMFA